MKKILVILAACVLTSISVSAQNWAIGARVGATIEFDAQYDFGNTYLEGRFGAGFCSHANIAADFSLLYNWKALEWSNWTPSAGNWFLDAGVGINVGGREHYAYVGPAGLVRFGIHFTNAPVSLSLDWNPAFGVGIAYWNNGSVADFNGLGLANIGITCVFHL